MLIILMIDKFLYKFTLNLWIYENHICELWSEELYEWRSSQLLFFSGFLFTAAKVAYITVMNFESVTVLRKPDSQN